MPVWLAYIIVFLISCGLALCGINLARYIGDLAAAGITGGLIMLYVLRAMTIAVKNAFERMMRD